MKVRNAPELDCFVHVDYRRRSIEQNGEDCRAIAPEAEVDNNCSFES